MCQLITIRRASAGTDRLSVRRVDDDERDVLVPAAVADNPAWCDAVCRLLGLTTRRPLGLWGVAVPPPLYPHLITLAPQVTVAEVVSELVPRTGSWVKDSFATLGLAEHGFSVIVQPGCTVAVGAEGGS